MSVFRTRHNTNFTTITNRMFDDGKLAADEIGILVFLLSRPQDWEVRRPALMRRWSIGTVAMKRIVNSWMRTGWCQARKVRQPNGQFYIEYQIYDVPGPGMTDDEIREALSLVSSEASTDESSSDLAGDHPPATASPPLCQPVLVDHPLAGEGWPNIDLPNNEIPRTDSTKKPEREGARAREKHALNLAEFKRRWPTNASDDQARVDNAWWALSNEEGEAALIGVSPFLDKLKRDHRKHPPAGFTFLSQKRWTLLEAKSEPISTGQYAPASREGRAIAMLYELADKKSFFHSAILRGGVVWSRIEITPQLLALADLQPRSEWIEPATHNGAGAWNNFIRKRIGELAFTRISEGAMLPKAFPPLIDGTWSPTLTNEDIEALSREGQR